MVANVNPIKNFEDFLYVASNLNKYDDLQFVIIGPIYETQIDYYKKLQVIISELNLKNISFVGAVENVFEYLEEFDIFYLLPHQNLPLLFGKLCCHHVPS